MKSQDPRESEIDRALDWGRVNPVGLLERPAASSGSAAKRRPVPRRMRLAAFVLLALFAFVTVATTISSLGAYCLTTDGGDLRELPNATRP